MPNILQVQNSINPSQIQNPSVGRPGQTNAGNIRPQNGGIPQGSSQETGSGQGTVNFESNYSNFVQRMSESMELPREIEQLLYTEGSVLQSQSTDPELVELLNQIYDEITMNDPQELARFIEAQKGSQVMFSGELFNNLRSLLRENISDSFREVILNFMKNYNNYASGSHYLQQMYSLGEDISSLMLPSQRGDWQELLAKLNWHAENGDTKENAQLINQELIPFLSKYVSRTHNYGAVRTASIMFSLYAVKYENGDASLLEKLFAKMAKNGDFRMLFENDPQEALTKALNQNQNDNANFSELFSRLLEKGTQGSAGSESIDQYYQVLNHLLANESVYMPLLHMLVPFRYNGKNVMSEMWVDPDAERTDPDAINKQKLFIKFDIQNVGSFEMISLVNNGSVSMQLYVPPTLEEKPEVTSRNIQDILRANGLRVNSLELSPRVRSLRVDEVFPEMRTKEKGINVAV